MAYSDTDRFKKKEDVMVQELGGEAVLLDLAGERYYGLDEVGLRMYQLIIDSNSVKETCDALQKEYEVEAFQLRNDLEILLGKLLEAGLLIRANE